LRNLIEVSRVIVAAALAREDSRGAHYREDHPDSGDLARSTYTVARRVGTEIAIAREPVRFTRVEPGESLLPPRTPPFRPAANMQ
jgi:fumarate reductase flavoprotein subunit